MHSGMESPKGVWWKPAHKAEKIWFGIAFAWCMVLFAMMPLCISRAGRIPPGSGARWIRSRIGRASTNSSRRKLKKGVNYTLHLSSADVNHGFSLNPVNVNFQVVPGYDYGLRIVPSQSGDFRLICNEFCGIGHHMMLGKVIVDDVPSVVARTPTPEGKL